MFEHIDTNNLHHAYLIEGDRDIVLPEILKFIESLGVDTAANSDFTHMHFDSLKIDDARDIKVLAGERGYEDKKKVFLISANSFLHEAQNTLLKIFEEPIENTVFFIVVPDKNALLKTLISRFYVIGRGIESSPLVDAEKFLKMNLPTRLEYIKELLAEEDEEDENGNEIMPENSARSKALGFLNSLESVLHHNSLKNSAGFTFPGVPGGSYTEQNSQVNYYEHIFKVRKFLRMPGSSPKNLMESVALIIPVL
jgi:hypothetical protein